MTLTKIPSAAETKNYYCSGMKFIDKRPTHMYTVFRILGGRCFSLTKGEEKVGAEIFKSLEYIVHDLERSVRIFSKHIK
jgi:hypothetical protein